MAQNQIGFAHQVAREHLRFVSAEVHVALHAHEQRAVARSRTGVRACAGTHCLDVLQPALDRDLARDRFGQRTATRRWPPGADEENPHALRRLRSNWERSREVLRPRLHPDEPRAVTGRCSRERWKAPTESVSPIQHAQLCRVGNRVPPLGKNLSR